MLNLLPIIGHILVGYAFMNVLEPKYRIYMVVYVVMNIIITLKGVR